MYKITPISAFSDNYIWMLTNEQYDQQAVAVIDPGDAAAVLNVLEQQDKKLTAILITHHHHDHTGGAKELAERFNIPIYGPNNCSFDGITHPLGEAEKLTLLGLELTIKEMPGHTLDHISYFHHSADQDNLQAQVFCGDTLFLAGCGRVFEGSMQQMLDAMRYFQNLPEYTQVYCTHEYSLANLAFAQHIEPENQDIQAQISRCQQLRAKEIPTLPTNIKEEKRINPFLRCQLPSVKNNLATLLSQPVSDFTTEISTFSQLRELKNNF